MLELQFFLVDGIILGVGWAKFLEGVGGKLFGIGVAIFCHATFQKVAIHHKKFYNPLQNILPTYP